METAGPFELPMFPLGTVLMPGALLPLQVFEPRYRTLVQRCMRSTVEPEFGVTLIERGSEVGGGDVRTAVGCIARIVDVAETPDGRYALMAIGTQRIRVLRWLPDDPHPRARVEHWPDTGPLVGHEALAAAAEKLHRVVTLHALLLEVTPPRAASLSDDPAVATWQVCAEAPLGPLDRQRLLSTESPVARIDLLGSLLDDEADTLERRIALG